MQETVDTSWETKLSAGFQWATCVKPNSKRLAELVALFHTLVSHYQAHPEETKILAESPEQAALQGVASVLLNLDEIMVK